MGAEIGATTSLFPFNDRMYEYLAATNRKEIGDFARAYESELREDEGAEYGELLTVILVKIQVKCKLMFEQMNLSRSTSVSSNHTSTDHLHPILPLRLANSRRQ